MTRAAEVCLWGSRVGVVSQSPDHPCVDFAYDGDFRALGVEPSPIAMPLAGGTYSFPELPERTFHGLPGLLSDSLPDKFGNMVLDAWLSAQGRSPGSLTPIERLCYTGSRGMGALEYRPVLMDGEEGEAAAVEVERLAELAAAVLRSRDESRSELVAGMRDYSSILKVGTSAGGARAKALIGWNESTGEVRSGQLQLPEGFGYWLIKFDGLKGNGDRDGDDESGYGRIEYAYHLAALKAGIDMTECRLWDGRHFMTRRFDRTEQGGKLHMQTLGAIAHLDFNNPGAHSYEQAFRVTRRLVGDMRAQEELFRRMAFNVLAWNCDDHVKNVAYLMDRTGEWRLAPAYDVTYAYNPDGIWTGGHQMSVNGKRRDITDDDMLAAAAAAGLAKSLAGEIIEQVRAATEGLVPHR